MDFLRRIEDDINNISDEISTKRKFVGAAQATEQALVALKSMRDEYVRDVMRKEKNPDVDGDAKLAKFRSIDVAAPYILAASQADAKSDLKLVMMAMNGVQMLLDFEVLPPAEAQRILMVLSRQAPCGRSEVQMKVN